MTVTDPPDLLRRTTAVLAVTQLLSWGTLYYAFAVVAPVLTGATGWSTTTISMAYSLGVLASGLAAPAVATSLIRIGPRRTMAIGSVVGGLGMVVWATATSTAQLFVAWLLIGVAMAATLYEPAIATVIGHGATRSRRSIVIITTAGGLASTIFGPLTHLLVQAFGWRAAVAILGVAVAAITVALHVLLPTSLQDKPSAQTSQARGVRAPAWLRTGVVLEQIAQVVTTVFLVSFLVDRGVASGTAAAALAAMGIGKLCGRLAIGAAMASIATSRVAAVVAAAKFVGLASMTIVDGVVALLMFAVIAGGALGISTVLRPIMIVEATGTDTYPIVAARLQRDAVIGRSAGPAIFGVLAGSVGWTQTWTGVCALFLAAAIVFGRAPGTRSPNWSRDH